MLTLTYLNPSFDNKLNLDFSIFTRCFHVILSLYLKISLDDDWLVQILLHNKRNLLILQIATVNYILYSTSKTGTIVHFANFLNENLFKRKS